MYPQKGIIIKLKLREKKLFFVGILKVTDENSRIRIRIWTQIQSKLWIRGSGSASGSACGSVPNVTDPQHCLLILLMVRDSQLKALIFGGVAAAPDSAAEGKKIKKKNSRLLSY